MASSPQPPTRSQRLYYLWLVMKRARFVVATCDRRQLSVCITDLHAANVRDGMAFQPMTDLQRATEIESGLNDLLSWFEDNPEDNKEGKAS